MVCQVHPIQKRWHGIYLYSLADGEYFLWEGIRTLRDLQCRAMVYGIVLMCAVQLQKL